MSRLRDGMRRTVLVGASVLREASAGVLDAVAELAAPQIRSASLERELELARQHGRWLSDDERADLLLREQTNRYLDKRLTRRHKLQRSN